MQFELNEDQKLIVETARNFSSQVFEPNASKWDRQKNFQ